jgi:hypothetical protein
MSYLAVSANIRELGKRLSNNNFDHFLPALLFPIRDSRVSRDRMNPAVA